MPLHVHGPHFRQMVKATGVPYMEYIFVNLCDVATVPIVGRGKFFGDILFHVDASKWSVGKCIFPANNDSHKQTLYGYGKILWDVGDVSLTWCIIGQKLMSKERCYYLS